MSAAARNQGDKIGVSGYRLNVVINQLWRRQKYALSLSLSLSIYIYIYICLCVRARALLTTKILLIIYHVEVVQNTL